MERSVPILALVGATASGKGELARELADATGASLVSVDSRKIYRGLDIGTAKPSTEIQARYHFAMIDIVDPDQSFSAGEYARRARAVVAERLARGEKVILVGGTGFYLDAFINGLAGIPGIDPEVRESVLAKAEAEGWESVYGELCMADPEGAKAMEPNDKTRILRAVEVLRQTGRPISAWQTDVLPEKAPWEIQVHELRRPVAELNLRIAQRVDRMIKGGLIEETAALLDRGLSPASPGLTGVGYVEVISFLAGRITQSRMLSDIVTHTRQYAKRQRTWFRHRVYVQPLEHEVDAKEQLIRRWLG